MMMGCSRSTLQGVPEEACSGPPVVTWWSSHGNWWLGGEGVDDDGPPYDSWWIGGTVDDGISHSSGSMGGLAPALLGLPIGGYFLGPRALHFAFPVSLPLLSRRARAFRLLCHFWSGGSAPPEAPWQLTVAPRVSLQVVSARCGPWQLKWCSLGFLLSGLC